VAEEEQAKHVDYSLVRRPMGGKPAPDQLNRAPVARRDHALIQRVRARSGAKPEPTFADRALRAWPSAVIQRPDHAPSLVNAS
jgi:hypothetical protein